MTYKQIQESVQRLHNKFSMLEPTISDEKSVVEKSDISQRQALKEHHQKLREEKFEKQ
jgi:hypothetical protein